MLTIHDLCVDYGDKSVLDHLNLNLEEGKIHGLVGLNGSGKTTLLNTLYGYKVYSSGTIKFQGNDLKRKSIAFLETESFYYANITGGEYLSLFQSGHPDYRLDDWNQIFKLPLDQLTDNYSTGMKKRLSIMAVLKQFKDIMILDEPFNGLDIESSRILGLVIKQLKEKGKTMIITSHILESLTSICDYIHYLDNKQISFSREKGNFEDIEAKIFQTFESVHQELIQKII